MLYAHLQSQMRSPTAPTPGGNGTLPTVAAARASVISLLRSTAELRGDELAAEFTLLHLLSHVRARPHGLAAPPIGDLPLNLILPNAGACGGTEVPRGTIEPGKTSQPLRLLQLLRHLLPLMVEFPMTVSRLNGAPLAPVKNYDTNRIQQAALQLSPRTHARASSPPPCRASNLPLALLCDAAVAAAEASTSVSAM